MERLGDWRITATRPTSRPPVERLADRRASTGGTSRPFPVERLGDWRITATRPAARRGPSRW
ncbi:hypothetical protein ABZ923_06620, partial [Streptomyces sp. NPDC046881]|uniref:hypothetical protein n=1 Tax=Streptomyces sp. NPDC046881 TaxID=3155374 RepID=UPI0033F0AB0A